MKKINISILGSTGSIGSSVFSIINKKKNIFKINLLSANKNYNLIAKQIKKYKPKYFIINDKKTFKRIKKNFKKTYVLNDFNFKKIIKSDLTISAIPGLAGLTPTLKMMGLTKEILIANKESIICGWNLIQKESFKFSTKITPIDSEHFSIFKLLEHHKKNEIRKIYITASGGPFLNYNKHQLKNIKPKNALKHPKWKMGKKISIDSATLMNKLFELVEAQKLFNIENNKIEILIHPDSLVHAIIEFKNGLTKFIYHDTTMTIPLANAIFKKNFDIKNFHKVKKNNFIEKLVFRKVDKKTFPLIKIKDKVNEYPSSPIIVNASNEVLVDQFLQKNIPFQAIFKIIMVILKDRNYKKYAIKRPKNINQINKIDNWAKKITKERIHAIYK
tara:strand:- start:30 stop:1193 length:1164 start_codon:yes stop_codon:yes gene_type:complete